MTKLLCIILAAFLAGGSPDAIVGDYFSIHGKDEYKVRVSEKPDGSFKAQLFWTKNSINPATGKIWTDYKNPDKSLRDTPCDQIVIIDGLKYNEAKDQWDGAKIYDPRHGIKANVVVKRNPDGNLTLKCSLLGISETVIWKKL